jgi:hypothetical protein
VSGQCLLVGVLLLALGGFLLVGNIRQAVAIRDAKRVEEVAGQSTPPPPATTAEQGEGPTNGPGAADGVVRREGKTEVTDGPTAPEVNRIPRVRVAAITMPLGVGILLIGAAVIGWFVASDQPAIVAATLSGVAGVLMVILGLEHGGSVLKLGVDPLGQPVAVLLAGGLLCLTLPWRLWLSQRSPGGPQ